VAAARLEVIGLQQCLDTLQEEVAQAEEDVCYQSSFDKCLHNCSKSARTLEVAVVGVEQAGCDLSADASVQFRVLSLDLLIAVEQAHRASFCFLMSCARSICFGREFATCPTSPRLEVWREHRFCTPFLDVPCRGSSPAMRLCLVFNQLCIEKKKKTPYSESYY